MYFSNYLNIIVNIIIYQPFFCIICNFRWQISTTGAMLYASTLGHKIFINAEVSYLIWVVHWQ